MPFSRPLVLASASARRARILAEIGVPFVVAPVDAPEPRTEDPVESAVAAALSKHAAARALHPGEFLCTADTLVECGGAVLGKPADRADAVAMLLRLSGRTHRVFTAVALSAPGAAEPDLFVEAAAVRFRTLTPEAASAYLDLAGTTDRAGAYDIADHGAEVVESLTGSRTCVMGLPAEVVSAWCAAHLPAAPTA